MTALPPGAQPIPLTYRELAGHCGPAVLRAVLRYRLGRDVPEPELARQLGTTPEDGTAPWDLVRVAERDYGLSARLVQGGTIDDLAQLLRGGASVILDIQAWPEPTDRAEPWRERWDDGHYVVLIAIDDQLIYVMDSSIEGAYGFIPRSEFPGRWHDERRLNEQTVKRFDRSYIHIRGGTAEVTTEPSVQTVLPVE